MTRAETEAVRGAFARTGMGGTSWLIFLAVLDAGPDGLILHGPKFARAHGLPPEAIRSTRAVLLARGILREADGRLALNPDLDAWPTTTRGVRAGAGKRQSLPENRQSLPVSGESLPETRQSLPPGRETGSDSSFAGATRSGSDSAFSRSDSPFSASDSPIGGGRGGRSLSQRNPNPPPAPRPLPPPVVPPPPPLSRAELEGEVYDADGLRLIPGPNGMRPMESPGVVNSPESVRAAQQLARDLFPDRTHFPQQIGGLARSDPMDWVARALEDAHALNPQAPFSLVRTKLRQYAAAGGPPPVPVPPPRRGRPEEPYVAPPPPAPPLAGPPRTYAPFVPPAAARRDRLGLIRQAADAATGRGRGEGGAA